MDAHAQRAWELARMHRYDVSVARTSCDAGVLTALFDRYGRQDATVLDALCSNIHIPSDLLDQIAVIRFGAVLENPNTAAATAAAALRSCAAEPRKMLGAADVCHLSAENLDLASRLFDRQENIGVLVACAKHATAQQRENAPGPVRRWLAARDSTIRTALHYAQSSIVLRADLTAVEIAASCEQMLAGGYLTIACEQLLENNPPPDDVLDKLLAHRQLTDSQRQHLLAAAITNMPDSVAAATLRRHRQLLTSNISGAVADTLDCLLPPDSEAGQTWADIRARSQAGALDDADVPVAHALRHRWAPSVIRTLNDRALDLLPTMTQRWHGTLAELAATLQALS